MSGRYNSNALQIPADYDQINLYNSDFSPSTVHVQNARLTRFFRKYLLQKAISVFKFTIPEEWDSDYFKYTLYGMGYLAVIQLLAGKTNRIICTHEGDFVDIDMDEGLAAKKTMQNMEMEVLTAMTGN